MSIGFVFTAFAWAAAVAATTTTSSYRIVAMLTSPFRSHYAVPERVLLGLAAKGHRVTVYTPFPRPPARLAVPFVAFAPNQLLPWHCDRLANPSNPAYVPSPLSGYAPPMRLGHRCCNAAVYALASALYRLVTLRANDAANRAFFGSDAPSLFDVVRRTSVLLANAYFSLNPLAPVVPSVVEISGANIEPAGQLSPVHTYLRATNVPH